MVYKYRFCGWVDVDLSTLGEHEAETAGQALVAAGLRFPFQSENTPPFIDMEQVKDSRFAGRR